MVELTEVEKATVVEITVGAIQKMLAIAWKQGYRLGNSDGTFGDYDLDRNPWRD